MVAEVVTALFHTASSLLVLRHRWTHRDEGPPQTDLAWSGAALSAGECHLIRVPVDWYRGTVAR